MSYAIRIACAAILALTFTVAHAQQTKESAMAPAPIVFFDIAGPDLAKQRDFYAKVFGWQSDATGAVKVPIAGPPLDGLLRTDPMEKVIYLGVPDITKTLGDVVANGGKVVAPRFEVKGVVVLGLFTDPAGNRMGVVEMGADGKAKIP